MKHMLVVLAICGICQAADEKPREAATQPSEPVAKTSEAKAKTHEPATQPSEPGTQTRVRVNFGKISMNVPKFENWNAVAKGMTREEVAKLLGKPLEESSGFDDPHMRSWKIYGVIKIADKVFPQPMDFMVNFEKQVVESKNCIWGDTIKISDKIPAPVILTTNHQKFTHYPRYLDVRWKPVPYLKSVFYEIETYSLYPGGGPQIGHKCDHNEFSDIPFITISFVGSQPGYLRIRAIDAVSQEKGEWSDYLYFDFSLP